MIKFREWCDEKLYWVQTLANAKNFRKLFDYRLQEQHQHALFTVTGFEMYVLP